MVKKENTIIKKILINELLEKRERERTQDRQPDILIANRVHGIGCVFNTR